VGWSGCDYQAQAIWQIVLNLLAFGMNPQRAVEAPRCATQTWERVYPRVYKPASSTVESVHLLRTSTRAECAPLRHT